MILYPYAEGTRFGFYGIRVVGSAVILLSVYAVSFRRGLLIAAIILAVPAFYLRGILPRLSPTTFSVLALVMTLAFDVFIVVIIFRRVFAREEANAETVFGALCIYLLVGFSFSSLYGMVSVFQPNSLYLDPHVNLHLHPNRFDFVYYSFGTMTSLGATGITPVSDEARSLTILEAILGVLYLAVLIARLMGAYRPGSRSQDHPQPPSPSR
ncbi:MAG TPA: ion channel [Terriglobales bacterium]|nr:ion channel [Terriglobales bacterium]